MSLRHLANKSKAQRITEQARNLDGTHHALKQGDDVTKTNTDGCNTAAVREVDDVENSRDCV